MSYDIHFCIREKNTNELIVIGESQNITWNVSELIKQSSGWDIKNEVTNGLAKDLVKKWQGGLCRLIDYPHMYKRYESPNGWGTVQGVKGLYAALLKEWEFLTGEFGRYDKLQDYIEIYVD